MDLKTFESTSTYAIEAVYNYFWDLIPSRYKLPEDEERVKDLYPFYDPELDFENRLHYKLSKIDYPTRANPWFIITWNTMQGLTKSQLTQRRFDSAMATLKNGQKVKFKFTRVELNMNLCITCNTMQGLFELQENMILKERDKITCYTKPHSIIGEFPICFNVINTVQTKMSKDKGTLCNLLLQTMIDYPVVGGVEPVEGGIIEQLDVHYGSVTEGEATDPQGVDKDDPDSKIPFDEAQLENGYVAAELAEDDIQINQN